MAARVDDRPGGGGAQQGAAGWPGQARMEAAAPSVEGVDRVCSSYFRFFPIYRGGRGGGFFLFLTWGVEVLVRWQSFRLPVQIAKHTFWRALVFS